MLWWSSLPCDWLLRNETELEQSALAIIIHLPSLLQGDGHLREILGGDKFNLLPITILPRHLLQKCDNKAGWWRRLNQKWVVDGVPAYEGKEFADRAKRAVQCEGSCWRDFRQFASSSSVRHWHLMISLESQSSCNIWFLYDPGSIFPALWQPPIAAHKSQEACNHTHYREWLLLHKSWKLAFIWALWLCAFSFGPTGAHEEGLSRSFGGAGGRKKFTCIS